MRRQGVGSILFREADRGSAFQGLSSLRITTGAQNQAMRALARKFGANLTFRHGKSTGTIDLKQPPQAELARLASRRDRAARAMVDSTAPTGSFAAYVWLGPDGLKRRG